MGNSFFDLLEQINDFIWGRIAFILITALGILFSLRSRFFQVRCFGPIFRTFLRFFKEKQAAKKKGIHPLKVFFAAIGGCIGIGNIVGISTAVQLGGPGALFWTWVGGLFGMLIQYSEVFLGMRHRVSNKSGSYDGGPMYFLPIAYKGKWAAYLFCVLLCIYGVELFMFNVMANSISINWGIGKPIIVALLLLATVVVATGGINRVGEVCSTFIPLFIALYIGMACWVIVSHLDAVPGILKQILVGAFTPQAAVGGFAGSSVALTISMGLSRGAYSGDIGVGYTSVIYSESRSTQIKRQSSLTIIAVFLDTFVICSLSIFVVLLTNVWSSGIDVTVMVQEALGLHFPLMRLFMPFFLFLLGYTTILAYFVVGVKCAKFIAPKWGPFVYYLYACITLPLFAFVQATQAFLIMSLSGALLLLLNLFGMFILRDEIVFGLED